MRSAVFYVFTVIFTLIAFPNDLIAIKVQSSSYKAAVVEHVPIMSHTENVTQQQALEIMNSNLDIYEQHMVNAKKEDVQIIVFPEDGLYGAAFQTRDSIYPYLENLPNIKNNSEGEVIIPCSPEYNSIPVLQRISCMAAKYQMITSVNMGDVQYCSIDTDPNCPSDGRYQYNTQVVCDETGRFIAKYHKSHLYYEPQFDAPSVPDVVYFDASFGVRFGVIICFDLMFESPLANLVEELGISDISFATWWVNIPPEITATQAQLAASSHYGINLLASGIGTNWYNSGSGIYSNGTILQTYYNPTWKSSEQYLVADVPILTSKQASKSKLSLRSLKAENLNMNGTVVSFVVEPGMTKSLAVSYQDIVHCQAQVTVSHQSASGEVFGLVAYSGVFGLLQIDFCGFMRCLDEDSCANDDILEAQTTFDSLELSSKFPSTDNQYVLPLAAMTEGQLMEPSKYNVEFEGSQVKMETTKVFMNTTTLNFAVFGVANWES